MSRPSLGELTARELAGAAGSTVRTIHYYTAEGLLPPPSGTTRNAIYTAGHLARLRLIAALREEGLALSAIRARIAPLTDEQVIAIDAELERHRRAGAPGPVSTLGLIEAELARHTAYEELPEPAPTAMLHMHYMVPADRDEPPPAMPATPALQASPPQPSARDYLDSVMRRPAAQPAPPMPRRQPPPPPVKPKPPPRPEVWYHFPVDDGVELRVREDRYHQAKGRLSAVSDALRATLQRYGLARDAPDDKERDPPLP